MTHHAGYSRFKHHIWDLISETQKKEPVDAEESLRNLGRTIREARRQKKLTQDELGELAGVNPKHLGEVEMGRGNPTVRFLLKVAFALGLNVSDLFLSDDNTDRERGSVLRNIFEILKKVDLVELQKISKVLKILAE